MDWWVVIAGGVFCGWVAGQKGYTGMLLACCQLYIFSSFHISIHIYGIHMLLIN